MFTLTGQQMMGQEGVVTNPRSMKAPEQMPSASQQQSSNNALLLNQLMSLN